MVIKYDDIRHEAGYQAAPGNVKNGQEWVPDRAV